MRTIFQAIYHLAFFKTYTDMPRLMEIGYSIMFWLQIAILLSLFKN